MNTCPYCGREVQRVGVHEKFCVERPETQRAILGAIIDTQRPGYAKTQIAYNAARNGAPHPDRLAKHYGTWNAACKHFGLRPRDGRAANGRVADWGMEPLTDAECHACTLRGGDEFAATQGVHSRWNVVDVWR